MAKTSGLNTRIYVAGYDISGDANSLDGVGYTQNNMITTPINKDANTRIVGMVDGAISVNVFFEATSEHAALLSSNKLPTGDRVVMVPMGSAIGDAGIGLVAKQSNYDISQGGTSSPVSASAAFQANGYPPEFGVMLTAHDDTHSSAASNASVDNSASSSNGGAGYIQAFSLASGTPTVKVEHSANNSSWSDLLTFTASTAISSQYKTVSGTVNRYIRVTSTGTFSNLKFACLFYRG
tara:strand:- start:1852 stop:2562 length:711 start_codon:yes stop_codon:yes gene_type:complete